MVVVSATRWVWLTAGTKEQIKHPQAVPFFSLSLFPFLPPRGKIAFSLTRLICVSGTLVLTECLSNLKDTQISSLRNRDERTPPHPPIEGGVYGPDVL